MVSGSQVQCQNPADSFSSYLSILRLRLSDVDLEEVPLDYKCNDH